MPVVGEERVTQFLDGGALFRRTTSADEVDLRGKTRDLGRRGSGR